MRPVLLLALTMALALAGCAASTPSEPARNGTADPGANSRTLVGENYRFKTLLGYGWNGKTYANSAQLHRAIDTALAEERPKVPKLSPTGAVLRVLRPNPATITAIALIANLRLVEARIEAIRASNLFQAVRVENLGPGRMPPQGNEYLLGFDLAGWTLLDSEERRISVANGLDLAGFVGNVANAVATLRDDVAYGRVLGAVQGDGIADRVLYRDKEYGDVVSLTDAFDRVNAGMAAQVAPAAKPLGGRALLVLPSRAGDLSTLYAGERPGLIDNARKAYRLALDRRFARFVGASKLFSEVRVEYADSLGQVPLHYDWLLWREANDPVWSARSRDVAFGPLPLSMQPTGFAAALGQALTLPPDLSAEATVDVSPLRVTYDGGVLSYDWLGRRFASEDELMRAATSALADEVAAVPPAGSSGRTLRVILPEPAATEGVVGRFQYRLDLARLDGLRKSGLVGDFAVETTALRDPRTEGQDFVLYRAADAWRLKDGQGRVLRLLVARNVPAFVGHVERALQDLSGELDYVDALPVKGGVVYPYRGREYGGLRGLLAAFEQQLQEEQRQVIAVAPVAGRALVVLPLDSTIEPVLRQRLIDSGAWAPSVAGFDAYQRFLDRRVAAFVTASGLFSTVRVVTAATPAPAQGDYDWVIWRRPGQPVWNLRAQGEAAFAVTMPAKAEGFALDLRALMTARR